MRLLPAPRPPVVALLVLALCGSLPAGEEAAPAAPPKPRAKITSPYIQSLLGSWDAGIAIPGGPELKGTARYWLALDGTALAEEFVAGEGDQAFHGFGIRYVLADGKSIRQWWFDTEGAGDIWPSEGPLTDDGWEAHSEVGGSKSVHRMKRDGEGHVFTMELGGTTQVTVRYTKAAADCPPAPVSDALRLKHPMIEAQLGSWDVKGVYRMGGQEFAHAGTSSMRLVVGGRYLLQEYEIRSAVEHSLGYGLSTLGSDGASLKMWWFSSADEKPTFIEGPVKETEWTGKASDTPYGPMEMSWTKTEAGFRMKAKLATPGIEGEETYTRKP